MKSADLTSFYQLHHSTCGSLSWRRQASRRMKNALHILSFLRDAIREGRRGVLVTLTDVVGSSARSPGTHMAVADEGSSVASFSGGCVEAAVIGEALAALTSGSPRRVRFGTGSPYIDIRLPCGGGMDLLFTPDPPPAAIEMAVSMLEGRLGLSLELGLRGTLAVEAVRKQGWHGDVFTATHDPDLQVLILGQGAEVLSLARQALAFTPAVRVITPDKEVVAAMLIQGVAAERLPSPSSRVDLRADADTAIVLLFHDHDWETELLQQALGTTAFYIGAMGSRATHATRRADLLDAGCTPRAVDRIVGPAGLIPASRDADTLAISILSQIVQEHGKSRARAGRRPGSDAPPPHRTNYGDDGLESQATVLVPGRSAA
ncbi:XdhC family protein [Sphingomonas sp. BK345]|uniref:XdhC family protein n=1 Tax=Sphingomonas sp. BK345 TaxID=2586980 RepID=UPI00162126E1|nr:XdhC family protein [Sphingomonas sp. BK345]MBB3475746.1 xanthine dehydrogenase accessory factor [Sphingomonas sp. BK345]